MICRIERPCRSNTLISTACSWVNISTARKKPPSSPRGVKITSPGVGQFYFGDDILVPRPRVRPGATVIVVPQAAIDLAKRFEGFHRVPKHDPNRAYPYICPAGYPTIGYGHLCDPKHPPITEAEAEAYLAQDLKVALAATLRYCPVLATEPEGRLAAIVDFTFNLGAGRLQTSTLRRRVNQRDWDASARELRRWVYGGGRVLPGLVTRREAEVALLITERR
jgi:lysozyme